MAAWHSGASREARGDDRARILDGARQWFEDLHQAWEAFESRVTGTEDRGDRTLCAIHVRARGRASGAAIEGAMHHVLEFGDRLILRLGAFLDRDTAVQALTAT